MEILSYCTTIDMPLWIDSFVPSDESYQRAIYQVFQVDSWCRSVIDDLFIVLQRVPVTTDVSRQLPSSDNGA